MDEINHSDQSGKTRTFAYVVMPDHLHWLLQLTGDYSLSGIVGSLKGRTSRLINAMRKKATPVWQRGFHDHALRRMESLHEAGYYIINNPVRAGLVQHYSEYEMWFAEWL